MKNLGTTVMYYGFLVIAGGLIGYLAAHSIASLVMGGLSGAALVGCALKMRAHSTKAYYAAFALTSILSAFFTYRFLHTFKVMPAGMMAVISFCVLAILVVGFFSLNKQVKRL